MWPFLALRHASGDDGIEILAHAVICGFEEFGLVSFCPAAPAVVADSRLSFSYRTRQNWNKTANMTS